ncbi:URC4/urg3 family protein [Mycolicibacterium senegalense]|uniref:URC4/urg3 family protein n=1 Tax=Mycolicibacterium TaxID=1866885 RepID=UPI0032047763
MTRLDIANEDVVADLRTTGAVRERAGQLLDRARAGKSVWFTVDDDALDAVARDVAELTRRRFPDLRIPYHSRWRHFEAGGLDRPAELARMLAGLEPGRRLLALVDLAVVSVLLDAGAGPDWTYHEGSTGQTYSRSEGLAVASWHAFIAGEFSSDPADPHRVDAVALQRLNAADLARMFQAGPENPLAGRSGRVELLNRLGAQMLSRPDVFGPQGRPGHLIRSLLPSAGEQVVSAHEVLVQLLTALSGVWPVDNVIGDVRMGDCWRHAAVRGPGPSDGWMPFHKLSQWLTYSLVEPIEWSGFRVTGLDDLTGLPEYRNGGLFLDAGVLALRNSTWAAERWQVGDELIVEWRALTVALLDELAPFVRARLGLGAAELPLACVLEGGTWAAGREAAARLRGGAPPLILDTDGTVF